MEIEDIRMTIVNALISTTIVLESIDEVKETKYFKGQLKSSAKLFEAQIIKTCKKQISDIWKSDEIAASDLTTALRDIGEHIANLKPSEIVELSKKLQI